MLERIGSTYDIYAYKFTVADFYGK